MARVEVFRGKLISDEVLNELRGKKAIGVLFYQEEKKTDPELKELQDGLRDLFTSGGRLAGAHTDLNIVNRWEEYRKKMIEEHGERVLIALFPGEGHRQITLFVHNLAREGIFTIDQLIEKKDSLYRLRGFYVKQRRAAEMIIDFFEVK